MRPRTVGPRRDAEQAVSEIMGVTMLLAMVITVMAGVVVVMQPFINDLIDNRDWAAGSVAATQFNDRLLVVADAPEGTGIVVRSQHLADTIRPLRQAELWTISADLAGDDRVDVSVESGVINVTSLNATAASVILTTAAGTDGWGLTDGEGENGTNLSLTDWVNIEVLDGVGAVIHRWVNAPLDGIQLRTPLKNGAFEIDLINGARIEQLPNQFIDVRTYPRLNHDRVLDGGHRVSLVLLDVDMLGVERSSGVSLDVESEGALTFFDGTARNLVIITEFTGDDSPESRYLHRWTDDYDLHRATGDSDSYAGFGPNGRVSGVEGMTLHPTDASFQLDVILQQVVVN
jgi:hypothetical protein